MAEQTGRGLRVPPLARLIPDEPDDRCHAPGEKPDRGGTMDGGMGTTILPGELFVQAIELARQYGTRQGA